MQLADRELRKIVGELHIETPPYAEPFNLERQIQPASIDLRVDRIIWKPQRLKVPIDLASRLSSAILSRRPSYKSDLGNRGKFRLKPGEMIMARTLEKFTVPEAFAAEIYTRSSFGRLGIMVTCAGYINPGYRGHMPLQIKNLGQQTVYFPPLISICQLVLRQVSGSPEHAYGDADLQSKYMDDDGGPSRWWMGGIIRKSQEALGAANLDADEQQKVLSILLKRDLSAIERFEQFLKRAGGSDVESGDAMLDAFAKSETRAMVIDRLEKFVLAPTVLLLISLSIGALFSTPFNETKYGALHITLWAVTLIVTLFAVPIARRRLLGHATDFLVPHELTRLRTGDSD